MIKVLYHLTYFHGRRLITPHQAPASADGAANEVAMASGLLRIDRMYEAISRVLKSRRIWVKNECAYIWYYGLCAYIV